MQRLPENEKIKYEREEEKKRRKRMQEIKEILWKKQRTEGEILLEKEDHHTTKTPEIKKLEERAENLEDIVEKYEKEKIERLDRQRILMEGENKKRKQKRERLELKAKLEEKWALMRWLVKHIEENREQWDMDREIRQNETSGESLTTRSETGLAEETQEEIQGEQQEHQGDCMSHLENLTKPEEDLIDSPLDIEDTRRNMTIMAESMNKWLAPRPWRDWEQERRSWKY